MKEEQIKSCKNTVLWHCFFGFKCLFCFVLFFCFVFLFVFCFVKRAAQNNGTQLVKGCHNVIYLINHHPKVTQRRLLYQHLSSGYGLFHQHLSSGQLVLSTLILRVACFINTYPHGSLFHQQLSSGWLVLSTLILRVACFINTHPLGSLFY